MTKRVRIVVTLAAPYAMLWLATAAWGVPQVEREVLKRPGKELIPAPEPGQFVDSRGDHHWADAIACAPFLVCVEYGANSGFECGGGGTEWLVWLPGISVSLGHTRRWIS